MVEPNVEIADSCNQCHSQNQRRAKLAAETQQSVPQTDSQLLTQPAADPVEPAPSTLVMRSGPIFKPPARLVEHC